MYSCSKYVSGLSTHGSLLSHPRAGFVKQQWQVPSRRRRQNRSNCGPSMAARKLWPPSPTPPAQARRQAVDSLDKTFVTRSTNLVRHDLQNFPFPLLRDDGAVHPLVELPRQWLGQLTPKHSRDALPPCFDVVALVQGHLDAPFRGAMCPRYLRNSGRCGSVPPCEGKQHILACAESPLPPPLEAPTLVAGLEVVCRIKLVVYSPHGI